MAGKIEVLVDTNFLVDVVRFKIDLGGELARLVEHSYGLFAVPGVEEELATLSEDGNQYARAALEMLHLGEVKKMDIEQKGDVDELIIEACKRDSNVLVATDDRKLGEKLRRMYIKVIYIRARKHLAID